MSSMSATVAGGNGMHLTSARLKSFLTGGGKLWPHPVNDAWQQVTPETLSQAGFYFAPDPAEQESDCVQCYMCQKTLDGWQCNDDPRVEHARHSAECPLVLLDAGTMGNGKKVSGEKTTATVPTTIQLQEARLATFGTDWWPHGGNGDSKLSKQSMASAGFILTPSDDYPDLCKCLHCGLSLDGWETGDDPVVEHLKRKESCTFFSSSTAASGGKKATKTGRRKATAAAGDASGTGMSPPRKVGKSTRNKDTTSVTSQMDESVSSAADTTTSLNDSSMMSTTSMRSRRRKEQVSYKEADLSMELSSRSVVALVRDKSKNATLDTSSVIAVPKRRGRARKDVVNMDETTTISAEPSQIQTDNQYAEAVQEVMLNPKIMNMTLEEVMKIDAVVLSEMNIEIEDGSSPKQRNSDEKVDTDGKSKTKRPAGRPKKVKEPVMVAEPATAAKKPSRRTKKANELERVETSNSVVSNESMDKSKHTRTTRSRKIKPTSDTTDDSVVQDKENEVRKENREEAIESAPDSTQNDVSNSPVTVKQNFVKETVTELQPSQPERETVKSQVQEVDDIFDQSENESIAPEDLDLTVEQFLRKMHDRCIADLASNSQRHIDEFLQLYDEQVLRFKQAVHVID